MADGSAIEWTDATWNPVTGCTKITRGCDNCYAARFSERFRDVPGHPFTTGFDLTLRPERLDQPFMWQRPRRIFVNSMSDLFHKQVPQSFIDQVFKTMEMADWHTFQVLTKRSSLMRDYLGRRYGAEQGPKHIWCGVSIEDAQATNRVEHLRSTRAGVRFLSIEPLIGAVGPIDLTGIDWVIAGGESGPGARPIRLEWVRAIRDQCIEQKVAFFFKQWGGTRPKSGGRELDGREWSDFPPLSKVGGPLMTRLPVVGPWAREKLDALARYLDFYTKVLKNQRWRTIYLDAFAGGGRCSARGRPREFHRHRPLLL